MKIKETVALIGEADDRCDKLMKDLSSAGFPVVLVIKKGNHPEELYRQILNTTPHADIETITCEKEGCWEADIIVLSNKAELNKQLLEKIREVANQKILLYFMYHDTPLVFKNEINAFRKLLPHVKWVEAVSENATAAMRLKGEEEAVQTITSLFEKINY